MISLSRLSFGHTFSRFISTAILYVALLPNSGFCADYGQGLRLFLEAEKELGYDNPFLSLPYNLLGLISKKHRTYGNIPPELLPNHSGFIKMICLMIPEDNLEHREFLDKMNQRLQSKIILQDKDRTYFRFFILPSRENLDHYSPLIKKYSQDQRGWLGLQTSSHRSLLLFDDDQRFQGFGVKVSSRHGTSGKTKRMVKKSKLIRSILVGDILASNPTNEPRYFEEFAGVIVNDEFGGNIYRSYERLEDNETAYISLRSILSVRSSGKSWLKQLADEQNMRQQEYVESIFVPMLIDRISKSIINFRLLPEFHQQNTLLVIDLQKNSLIDIGFRDLDGVFIFRSDPQNLPSSDSFSTRRDTVQIDGMYNGFLTFQYLIGVEAILSFFGSHFRSLQFARRILNTANRRLLDNMQEHFPKVRTRRELREFLQDGHHHFLNSAFSACNQLFINGK